MVGLDMNKFLAAKGQKVVCLNIRLLYANFLQLELDFKNSGVYAKCLTETWLKPSIATGIVNLDGYTLVRRDRQGRKRGGMGGGGWVCCYIRNDLSWSSHDECFNVSTGDIEMLTLMIQRKYQNPLIISTAYLPPTLCLTNALHHLEMLSNTINWIWCGDFKVDYNLKTTQCKRLIAFTNTNLLSQLITTATRTTDTTSSLIDHMYTTINPNLTASGVIKYGLSDHDLIFRYH